MPVHSSVLGTTNTDDPEAAAITRERKKIPAHSLPLGERNTEDAVEVESSSENIKAVFVQEDEDDLRWERSIISKMLIGGVKTNKQITWDREADLKFLFDGALLNTSFL